MRAHSHRTLRLHESGQARELLGTAHALVRILELQDVVRRDLLVLGALVPATLGAAVLGSDAAAWLTLGAAIAIAALGGGAALLHVRRREAALTLIVEGRDRLPLAAVARERERLLDPAYRRMLAHSLALLRSRAETLPDWFRTSPIPYNAAMLRSVADELRELERLLTCETVGVRGVALTHRLLVDGHSPLHGNDARQLSEELRRIAVSLR
jgi:hypothetical protein